MDGHAHCRSLYVLFFFHVPVARCSPLALTIEFDKHLREYNTLTHLPKVQHSRVYKVLVTLA